MPITPKRALVLGVVAVLVAAAIVAIVFASIGSRDSKTTTKEKGGSSSGTSGTKKPRAPLGHGLPLRTASGSSSLDDEIPDETTDPTTEVYSLSALAIGDWGRTVAKDGGSCCQRRKSFTVLDYNAMEYTASLLGLAAAQITPKPSVILGHGDNFYWTGLQSASDQAYRFMETFESKYNDAALQGIPWVNVVGNHDYGGASFVCSQGDVPAKCGSTSELLASLAQKFTLQSQYVSPNGNRWQMPARFFTHQLRDPVSGMTVEIFNMDTNDAESHGARQICCQCYGYADGNDDKCEDVDRGHPFCAGGDGQMYDACMKQLKTWAMETRGQLEAAAKASNATWKIVNTHYSPYNHYGPEQTSAWRDLLTGLGINVFFYGHTHGEKHDYAKPLRTHFIENGAGGGIQNESPSGIPPYAQDFVENVWAAGHYPYGIFALRLSPTWAQVQFLTFDKTWVMQKELAASRVGGIAAKHCWFIPRHGGRGRRCATDSGDA
jgi:tartrate-resistant acid phosphatase type 5